VFRERTFALHRQRSERKFSKMLTLPPLEKFLWTPMPTRTNTEHAESRHLM